METVNSTDRSLRVADRPVGPVQRTQASSLDRQDRNEALEPRSRGVQPSVVRKVPPDRRSALVEEFRAHQQLQARRQAARAAAPAPQAPPARDESIARQQRMTRDLVDTLARHRPPSEGRRLAAGQARELRQSKLGQVQQAVERQRARRGVLQERARAAYHEAAGLSPDSGMD